MRCAAFLALFGLTAFAAPAPIDPKFTAIFDVAKVHAPALSPDGRHVAFGLREGENVFVGVLNVDAATVGTKIQIGVDNFRVHGTFVSVQRPQVNNIVWISPRRFIVTANSNDIFAVDFDGTKQVPLTYLSSDGRMPASVVAVTPDVATMEAFKLSDGFWAAADKDITLFKFDAQTGRPTRVGELSINGRLFYDHEGQPRAYMAARQVPFRAFQRPPDAPIGTWRPLDLQQDASQSEFTATAEKLIGHRSLPLGFAFDASTIYIASNVGRDTYGVYGFDLQSGRRTTEAMEHGDFDLIVPAEFYYGSTLVLDRYRQKLAGVRFQGLKAGAVWVDRELQEIQARIEAKSPRRSMEILGWDESRERFLAHGYHRADPGAYLIYNRREDRLQEYLPLRTSGEAATQPVCTPWSIRLPDGRKLSGNLTRPAGRERVPTVIVFPQRAWLRAGPEFLPEVEALASMGYAVLEVHTRGLPGFGLEHWLAGRSDPDRVVMEDVFAALDAIAKEAGIESKQVTLFGSHFGARQALRTLQLAPERIRTVAVLDPSTDLSVWIEGWKSSRDPRATQYLASLREYFGSDAEQMKRCCSPLQHPFPAKVPVLVVQNWTNSQYATDYKKLRDALRKANSKSRWIDPPALRDPTRDPSFAFTKIEAFLREHRDK